MSPDTPCSGLGDGGLIARRPPPQFVPVRRWVLDTFDELRDLRAGVREEVNSRAHQHAELPLGQVASHLVLIASDLATNGIRWAVSAYAIGPIVAADLART